MMNRQPVLQYNGQDVTIFVLSSSGAQAYGLSPWADWIWLNGDGVPSHRLWRPDGTPPQRGKFVKIQATLPAKANEGDTCELRVHGSDGTYQTWHAFRSGAWQEEASTVPWQMRA